MNWEMVPLRYVKIALYAMVATALQSTVFSHLAVKGIRPELVLIMAVVFGLLGGWKMGITIALIGGAIEGAMLGQVIGVRVLLLLIAGISAGLIASKVDRDSLLTLVVAVLLATIVDIFTGFVWMFVTGVEVSVEYAFMEVALPKLVYNIVVAVVCRRIFYHLFFCIEGEEFDIPQVV